MALVAFVIIGVLAVLAVLGAFGLFLALGVLGVLGVLESSVLSTSSVLLDICLKWAVKTGSPEKEIARLSCSSVIGSPAAMVVVPVWGSASSAASMAI